MLIKRCADQLNDLFSLSIRRHEEKEIVNIVQEKFGCKNKTLKYQLILFLTILV
jgi:hypothetical protein